MARISQLEAGGKNMTAFLDLIGFSELGAGLMKISDEGYNVIVGSTVHSPILFHDYTKHPNRKIRLEKLGIDSTAAGRYQILYRYASVYQIQLQLPDFGPVSQDKIALQLIRECKAVRAISSGDIASAIHLCRSRWASFPGAGYGQHENGMDSLIAYYIAAGGKTTKGQ